MWLSVRRRLALFVCPELLKPATFPDLKNRPRNLREEESRFIADQVRRLASLYLDAGGELPVWKENRARLIDLGFDWSSYTDGKTIIRRLVRTPSAGCRPAAQDAALHALSLLWPSDLEWPRDIPRPKPTNREAA